MARKEAALKSIRQSKKRRERNRSVKSQVKTAIKSAEGEIRKKAENALSLVKAAIKIIDKAVSNKIIHKQQGARRKSRLMIKYNTSSK